MLWCPPSILCLTISTHRILSWRLVYYTIILSFPSSQPIPSSSPLFLFSPSLLLHSSAILNPSCLSLWMHKILLQAYIMSDSHKNWSRKLCNTPNDFCTETRGTARKRQSSKQKDLKECKYTLLLWRRVGSTSIILLCAQQSSAVTETDIYTVTNEWI